MVEGEQLEGLTEAVKYFELIESKVIEKEQKDGAFKIHELDPYAQVNSNKQEEQNK